MNADRTRVGRLCVLLFDRIQLHPIYEEQVLALAGAFALMCDVLRVAPQDAFTAVKNLMVDERHPDGLLHQFAAMKHHLATELCA